METLTFLPPTTPSLYQCYLSASVHTLSPNILFNFTQRKDLRYFPHFYCISYPVFHIHCLFLLLKFWYLLCFGHILLLLIENFSLIILITTGRTKCFPMLLLKNLHTHTHITCEMSQKCIMDLFWMIKEIVNQRCTNPIFYPEDQFSRVNFFI